MKEPILVVDDDRHICDLIKMYLEDDFRVEVIHDGITATDKVIELNPVLVVLDIMLPGKNGWEVCKEIRRKMSVPIIMLTAKGEEIDKVLGLELGADDYITKPFSPRELSARVKAVLRRTRSPETAGQVIRYPGIVLDASSRQVKINNEPVELTPKEFELLWQMASNPGKVFTRERLLDIVWGYDFEGDTRAVDSQIKRLRRKLEAQEDYPAFIQTVWGIGYKFEV